MAVFKFKDPRTGKWLALGYATDSDDHASKDLSNVSNEDMKAKVEECGFTGGLLPQIIVTAEPGSTVTCTKGDIVLTAEEVDGTWTFDVTDYGKWTVAAEYNSLLTVTTVFVDCVKQYAVTLNVFEQNVNYTMLYYYGDENADVTGGWNVYNKTAGYSTITKNGTDIYMQVHCSAGTTRAYIWVAAAQEINISEYTKLMAKTRFTVKMVGCQNLSVTSSTVAANTSIYLGPDESYAWFNEPSGACDKTSFIQLDISQVENGVPVMGMCNDFTGQMSTVNLYAMFLLKHDEWEHLGKPIGGITWETMDSLLVDADGLAQILGNETSVRYMVNWCTGDFMASAIQSPAFLTALEASPYKELIYANEHWAKFLAMVA